jgi:hypothetical protein
VGGMFLARSAAAQLHQALRVALLLLLVL